MKLLIICQNILNLRPKKVLKIFLIKQFNTLKIKRETKVTLAKFWLNGGSNYYYLVVSKSRVNRSKYRTIFLAVCIGQRTLFPRKSAPFKVPLRSISNPISDGGGRPCLYTQPPPLPLSSRFLSPFFISTTPTRPSSFGSIHNITPPKWTLLFSTILSIVFSRFVAVSASRFSCPSLRSDNSVKFLERFSCSSLICWSLKHLSRFVVSFSYNTTCFPLRFTISFSLLIL